LLSDGTAWLSSVRVVKCNIKLFNERNPYHMFYTSAIFKDTYRTDTLKKPSISCVTTEQVRNPQS